MLECEFVNTFLDCSGKEAIDKYHFVAEMLRLKIFTTGNTTKL